MLLQLMSPAEIHDFGVEIVFGYLKREGHEILAVNTDPTINPQVVAKKDGQLEFIVVRTACYPGRGALEGPERMACTKHAEESKALCYFASVGIANASGSTDAELASPVKGAGFHAAFEGLELLQETH